MKETVKTSRTAGYLEKIFRAVNARATKAVNIKCADCDMLMTAQ